jgi:outer membrane protein TolC
MSSRFVMPVAAALAMSALATLTGCAQMPPDGGVGALHQITQAHLGQALTAPPAPEQQAQVQALLAQPLSPDSAVQLMLLNAPAVRMQLLSLGLAEADLAAASRLPNPGLSFARLAKGEEVEIERGLHFSLSRLLTWPIAREIEANRLTQTRLDVAREVIRQAFEVRQAWYQAVAARELAQHSQRVLETAQIGAELARRMRLAGNWNRLKESTELGFEAEALAQHQRAQLALHNAHEQLAMRLGLPSPQALQLPAQLPALPRQPQALPQAEQTAVDQRLDVQAARLWAEHKARQSDVTGRLLGFVNVLDLNAGVVNNSSNEAPRQRGYEVSLSLPLFDWGGLKATQAEWQYQQAVAQAAHTAQQAQAEVRLAHASYLAQFSLARHQLDTVLPLRKDISREKLLRYNGMLIGVFELLADAREQGRSVQTAIEAQRDAWIARAALDLALSGPAARLTLPDTASASQSTPTSAGH